jgi:hypothetical protein
VWSVSAGNPSRQQQLNTWSDSSACAVGCLGLCWSCCYASRTFRGVLQKVFDAFEAWDGGTTRVEVLQTLDEVVQVPVSSFGSLQNGLVLRHVLLGAVKLVCHSRFLIQFVQPFLYANCNYPRRSLPCIATAFATVHICYCAQW